MLMLREMYLEDCVSKLLLDFDSLIELKSAGEYIAELKFPC